MRGLFGYLAAAVALAGWSVWMVGLGHTRGAAEAAEACDAAVEAARAAAQRQEDRYAAKGREFEAELAALRKRAGTQIAAYRSAVRRAPAAGCAVDAGRMRAISALLAGAGPDATGQPDGAMPNPAPGAGQ